MIYLYQALSYVAQWQVLITKQMSISKKNRNERQSILSNTIIIAQWKFKPLNVFRGFTLSFLQKLKPQPLLFFSYMTGLRYFLTKGLNPVTVEGRHLNMWLFKPLQFNVVVDVVQKP